MSYHFYCLDKFGEIIGPAQYLTCLSDPLAMTAAAELIGRTEHAGVEVWDGVRLVGRIPRPTATYGINPQYRAVAIAARRCVPELHDRWH